MNTYPTLSRSPGIKGFTRKIEEAHVGRFMDGYPVIIEVATFIPTTFKHTKHFVSQVDMETVVAFYKANRGVSFYWVDTQKTGSPVTYEVIYIKSPDCQLDGLRDLWRITEIFKQSAPL